MMCSSIKNLAIIAHVDHGKTTLVDAMFRQSGLFRDNQKLETCAMDSNELERERGITILAKCTSFTWNGIKLNIVDTPGHADFGGEVERILSMVDGVLVLVDAAEGPMPQTKFVLSKALALGLNPIVVINKIDKSDARVSEVVDEVFNLFLALGANDTQLDFPILYASGRDGWAIKNFEADERKDLTPLLETIVQHIPDAKTEEGSFRMLVTMLEYDQYLGRVLTGKILSGTARINDAVHALRPGIEKDIEQSRLTKLLTFEGLKRIPVEEAMAGDIVAIAGLTQATVADTICAIDITEPLHSLPIDPPTISMTFAVNDSPLAGKEGKSLTSRVIGDRLFREAEGNVSITVKKSTQEESYEVAGRGELQLGVLIETMRREGFELSIGRPRVLMHKDEAGNDLEPMEELFVDIDDEFTGAVVDKLIQRKGEMVDMRPSGTVGKTRIKFIIPTRGLIGYYGEFLTDTRGSGVMNRSFHSYGPYKGPIAERERGVLISVADGKAVPYALFFLKDRGTLFIHPGDPVYTGMIIGENSRENELEVNPMKEKQLSNCRAAGKDENIKIPNPREMSLEQAIAYIQSDEQVEVTPKSIRLRKKYLDSNTRKKLSRAK